jgi:uncharacterized membrane protein YjjP (DUF1212 family)
MPPPCYLLRVTATIPAPDASRATGLTELTNIAHDVKSAQLTAAELAEYLLDLGGTLLSYGCPTHRLEEVIRQVAEREGFKADSFAVPTGMWMSVRGSESEAPVVRMIRVGDWAVDLARLNAIDRIFNDVLARRLTLAEARRRIDEVEAAPPTYAPLIRLLAMAVAAGASAVFFRGGSREVAAATLGGVLVGLLRASLSPRLRLLQDFLGGLIAAGLAWGATALATGVSREVLILSVIVLLVPGMALTTGLSELAHKNLVSGASRLMEAFMAFLSILMGIAVVLGVEQMLHLQPRLVPRPEGFPLAVQIAALIFASLSFGVTFSMPRPILFTAIGSGAIAWGVPAWATGHAPVSMAAFLAALGVSLYANVLARTTQRPSQTFLLPGLVLLVPGSFGFLSLEAFLRGEFLGGAAKAFDMFLIAGSIVIGLLVAKAILPSRKWL